MSWVIDNTIWGTFSPCAFTGATIQEGEQSTSNATNTLFDEGTNFYNLYNETTTTFFDNGILKIELAYVNGNYNFRCYYNDVMCVFGTPTQISRRTYYGECFLYNDDLEIATLAHCYNSANLSHVVQKWFVNIETNGLSPEYNYENKHNLYLALKQSMVSYNWSSVPAISGKNGILSLTMIKDDKIEEGTTTHQILPEDNIERYTDQSNMRKLCLNHVVNEWFTCAESGLNYMQLRYNYGGVDNDILIIEFKIINHYGEGNNQYYAEVYSGSIYQPPSLDGLRDAFLAFIIDEENEVAQFDPVTHYQLSSTTPPLFGVDYGYLQPNDQQMAGIYYFLKGSPEDIDEDDPYSTGSEGDGGDGNPYQPQDHLGLSAKPTKSGLNLGVVTLYNPSDSELASIAQFLWSDDTLENFKKYFNNFADNLMALYVLPVAPEAAAKASKVFKVGNLVSSDPSLQSVDYITDRYADIDMGSFYLKRKWDSYLDVSPYTKLEIYLPYCGTHQLNTDEIVYPANMEGFLPTTPQDDIELKLNYRIDLVTGNIVATLFINGENRYQFTGKCGMSIPLTGANYNNMVQGAITAGAGFAATIASGGLTAPLTASAAVSGTVMATKPDVYRSGNLSGDVSMLGYDTPYLIKTIPNKPKLTNQENYTGLPSYKKDLLGNFSGYTEVIEAHIDNVSCTDAERDKIMAYLKGGVLI